MTDVRRSGFIAVAGRPNAGKSTLVNRIVGRHVAIVSPVAQTTRRVVRAVAHRGDAQLVFVDLPGTQRPVDRLTERMQRAVEHALRDVDAVLWVVDAAVRPGAGERAMADLALGAGVPVVIAANKIDIGRAQLPGRIQALADIIGERHYEALIPVSAANGDGVEVLLDALVATLPEGPAWFGDDDVTDMRDEERIAEYVREATLTRLRDELPHATLVTVDELAEADGRLEAECTIWVERESQVGIVVGAKGVMIRDIGTAARRAIDLALDTHIHLSLRVKVRRGWRDDEAWLGRSGL